MDLVLRDLSSGCGDECWGLGLGDEGWGFETYTRYSRHEDKSFSVASGQKPRGWAADRTREREKEIEREREIDVEK